MGTGRRFHYRSIEWDEGNIFKNEASHGVKFYEIEEAIENEPKCIIPHKRYSDRFVLLGRTNAGRYLFVVYQEKRGGVIRPIHAHDMEMEQRDFYRRNRRMHDR